MPLYEYECDACQKRFERIHKYSDPPIDVCPNCGKGPVRKLPSSPAIQFKGSGFYITDYAKKGTPDSSGAANQGKNTSTDSSSGSTSTSSDSSSSSTEAKPAPASSSSTDKSTDKKS
jgi:putative FmdB family regulatory protein